jgi:hypothetical protein
MNMVHRIGLASLAALLLAASAVQQRDWAFVRAVGGMALGAPYRTPAGVMLPIDIDVTGLRSITTKPTTMNSALALEEISVRQQGDRILLKLTTAVGGKGSSHSSKDLLLGSLAPGRYVVQFIEPGGAAIEVGTITVPP